MHFFSESSASASLLGPIILFIGLVFELPRSVESSVFITTAVRTSNPTFPTYVHPVIPETKLMAEKQNMCDHICVPCNHRMKLSSVILIPFF
jgi:hypothetical protein